MRPEEQAKEGIAIMFSLNDLKHYCISQLGAEETYPFGPEVIVYKIMGKMFALVQTNIPQDQRPAISLKCDPTFAEILRENYDAIKPGYHLNKRHWNTVTCDGTIPDDEIEDMIKDSYRLVVKSLTKAERERVQKLA